MNNTNMNIPAFTAELSLQKTMGRYYVQSVYISQEQITPQARVNCNFLCGQLRMQCSNRPSWLGDPFGGAQALGCLESYGQCLWSCGVGDLRGAIESF